MAKILSISMNKTDNSELMSRQIPLIIDNSLTVSHFNFSILFSNLCLNHQKKDYNANRRC